MKTQLEKRLTELKVEYEAGQKMLADLETRQQNLRETLIRISGAIQVLEEELRKNDDTNDHENAKQKKIKNEDLNAVDVSAHKHH